MNSASPVRDARTGLLQLLPTAAFAVFATIALASPLQAPRQGQMAVVFPPFTSEQTAWALIRAAGGAFVAPTKIPNIVIAYGPDQNFQTRLRGLGAWFFVAAEGLCTPNFEAR